MNDNFFEMISIIVLDQPDAFDICSWWARPVLAEMTHDEQEKLEALVHELCIKLRPILARMEQKSISQNMPPPKRMQN